MKKPGREVYDQNHYKAQGMLRDPWFIEKIAWLKKRFAEVGCPLPARPFKTYAEYDAWNKVFWHQYVAMEKHPEYIAAKLRITGNKERMPSEEYWALEVFREKFFPPVYGETYREILLHFGIDPKHSGFNDFLEQHIFYGKNRYPASLLNIIWKRDDPTKPMDLYIGIEAHTKLEDIERYWPEIVREQKRLPNFSGKNKPWKNFERDLLIYKAYNRLKKSDVKRQKNGKAIDDAIYREIATEHPDLTLGNIRMIVTKAKKRLGEIVL